MPSARRSRPISTRKLAEAEARIATIKAKAMTEVGTIAEDTASAIVEQLIGGKVDKADGRGCGRSRRG